MPRPVPTPVVHFTHIRHVATVARHGLLSDNAAVAEGLLSVEVGNRDIKRRRRERPVTVSPGGTVADYVPFYFAPRSPMMFAIDKGRVPEYVEGIDPFIYLVTDVERLTALGLPVVFTDRNAVLDIARFSNAIEDLDDLVDWPLMKLKYWRATIEEPDRVERRMAECLVHERVPWEAFTELVVRSERRRDEVLAALGPLDVPIRVRVAPDWYF